MKVLMTADTVGGVWTYSLELAAALAPHGVDVALCSMGAPLSEAQHRQVLRLENLSLCESVYRLEWMDDPWPDVYRAGDWLLRLEDDLQPDIVHLNGYALGALPWHAPVVMVGHSCVLSWWRAVKGEDAPPSWDRYRFEVTQGLCAADLVAAPTAAMLAALQRHYGSLPSTAVVPNGVDPTRFAPAAKENLILSAGRLWDEAKNLVALDAVAPRLDWPVYIAGEGRHPSGGDAAPVHARCLGVLSREQLSRWYARAGIYALPARYEPFGLSAVEAALAGCALVLGDIDSLREVWGDAATFVPPDDHDALAHALALLANDADARRAAGLRARRRALEFSPERMALGYLEAYRDVRERAPRAQGVLAAGVET